MGFEDRLWTDAGKVPTMCQEWYLGTRKGKTLKSSGVGQQATRQECTVLQEHRGVGAGSLSVLEGFLEEVKSEWRIWEY